MANLAAHAATNHHLTTSAESAIRVDGQDRRDDLA
jgi:hypothetical protein